MEPKYKEGDSVYICASTLDDNKRIHLKMLVNKIERCGYSDFYRYKLIPKDKDLVDVCDCPFFWEDELFRSKQAILEKKHSW